MNNIKNCDHIIDTYNNISRTSEPFNLENNKISYGDFLMCEEIKKMKETITSLEDKLKHSNAQYNAKNNECISPKRNPYFANSYRNHKKKKDECIDGFDHIWGTQL